MEKLSIENTEDLYQQADLEMEELASVFFSAAAQSTERPGRHFSMW